MKPFIPGKIVVDEESVNDPLAVRVLSNFANIPYEILPSQRIPGLNGDSRSESGKPDENSITKGKNVLYLRRNRGPFIERCPGTKNALCCNYFVANLAVNCHFDCTYCYLQSYLNTQNITIYTNIQDFLAEVKEIALGNPGDEIRIGTGELADSLAFDEITGFTKDIVPFFGSFDNVLLELKTKGDYTGNLVTVDPGGRTVIAWSLNPQVVIDSEEHKTSSLSDRLAAARELSEAGYKLAFHFDPIILHKGWEENYREVVRKVFETVSADDILWISLGVLRFTQAGKSAIQKRFPKSDIVYEEMVQGPDGKLRYIQPVRVEIFRKMRQWIAEESPGTYTYLCMESQPVFSRVYGDEAPILNEIAYF